MAKRITDGCGPFTLGDSAGAVLEQLQGCVVGGVADKVGVSHTEVSRLFERHREEILLELAPAWKELRQICGVTGSWHVPIKGIEKLEPSPPPKVILSYGMGVESTAILDRWLNEPKTRWVIGRQGQKVPFELDELLVITSQVGNEFAGTGAMVEQHILPQLREHNVRFVQVARAAKSDTEGVVVLDDTRSPHKLHLEGVFNLSDELLAAGTVPTKDPTKGHRCSIKFKGWVLDRINSEIMQCLPFFHVIGYNLDEVSRYEKDQTFNGPQRWGSYPLVDWGWGRDKTEAYLEERFGRPWPKSCCTFCPFSGGKAEHMQRFVAEPEAAVEAILIDTMSLALNPRVGLFSSARRGEAKAKTAYSESPPEARKAFDAYWTKLKRRGEWSLYRVRRAYRAKANASRQTLAEATGSYKAMVGQLNTIAEAAGLTVDRDDLTPRVITRTTQEPDYPTAQEMFVVAPAGIEEKQRVRFERDWLRAVDADDARTDDRPPTDWVQVAKRVILERAAGVDDFTKGHITDGVWEEGPTNKEASQAFDALVKEGAIIKRGRRWTLATGARS